ncbi:hypothetical protein OROHE_014360 [Orobanche hederae]
MATVVGMVRKLGMTGSLGNLFESIENLDPMFLPPGQSKALLKPTRSSAPLNVFLRFNDHDSDDSSDDEDIDYTGEGEEEEDDDEEGEVEEGEEKVGNEEEKEDYSLEALFCKCPECKNSGYSVDKRAICPTCGSHMTSAMQFVPYVLGTGATTNEVERMNKMSFYMVMDDLVVKPMSAVSTITLLKEFNVKDVTLLQERVVHLGIKEALMLLNSSLHSKKVLTEVFINNQAEVESLEVKMKP